MNTDTLYPTLPATQKEINGTVYHAENNTHADDSSDTFDSIDPLTDMLIRSQKHVKIDSIVYYMVVMMVALVSLTAYFYSDML